MVEPDHVSPRSMARIIAVLFLVTIVLGVVAQMVISERLLSFRDPARTASNILANEGLYDTGFLLYMIEMSAQVGFTVLLFHLLRPVDGRVATLALAFGLVGCTIKTFSRVFYLVLPVILKHAVIAALPQEQVGAITLSMMFVNDRGAGVALAFFGFETVLEGWLVLRSTFLPRWLGGLQIIGGVGWLTFLSPTLGYAAFNLVAPLALLVALVTIGWLLLKGVDEPRWHALAASPAKQAV